MFMYRYKKSYKESIVHISLALARWSCTVLAAALSVVRDLFYLTNKHHYQGKKPSVRYIDILHREASAPYVTSH